MRKATLVAGVVGVLALGTLAWAAAGTAPVPDRTVEVRVDMWKLLQSDGAELYQELCASCHGTVTPSGVGEARVRTGWGPPLTLLESQGIPKEHWAYVITSRCEDSHHWGPGGAETMPCWSRIFRQALGNDAAPMLVSGKLVDYLEEIQQ